MQTEPGEEEHECLYTNLYRLGAERDETNKLLPNLGDLMIN